LAEEDELSEQLKDVTVNRSQPEENHIEVFVPLPAKKRIQWPPAYHEINVGSVDSNSNVQQSVIDEQLNDIDLKETTETTCDQLDEVTNNPYEESVMEETQIDSSVSSELNSNGKDEETDIISELADEISYASIPNKLASESRMPVQRNRRRESLVALAVPPSPVLDALMHKPKMVVRRSSRPAIPGLILSSPIKAAPYSQPSRPVISSHPVFKRTTPSRTCGATVWPPKFENEELTPKREEAIPPKRQQIDPGTFYAASQQVARFSTYHPPPGSQRVRTEVVEKTIEL